MEKKDYKKMRKPYVPTPHSKLKVLFILESPPVSGKYFYDSNGDKSEPLFKAMMDFINEEPENKEDGLIKFGQKGYLIVDATYKPVNKCKNKERNSIICDSYSDLKKELNSFVKGKAKIVLVKVNVCKILNKPLADDGFNVINNGLRIPFPSHHWQREFKKRLNKLLPAQST